MVLSKWKYVKGWVCPERLYGVIRDGSGSIKWIFRVPPSGTELESIGGLMEWLKRFLCGIGWHSFPIGFGILYFDGCSEHGKCKWCGYEGMIDSQGNLF